VRAADNDRPEQVTDFPFISQSSCPDCGSATDGVVNQANGRFFCRSCFFHADYAEFLAELERPAPLSNDPDPCALCDQTGRSFDVPIPFSLQLCPMSPVSERHHGLWNRDRQRFTCQRCGYSVTVTTYERALADFYAAEWMWKRDRNAARSAIRKLKRAVG